MTPTTDRRVRAYRAGARMTRARIQKEAPLDAEALACVTASDVVVVPGSYDHVERVLEALEMPFTRIDAGQIGHARLRPEQLLIVNCPGNMPRTAIEKIRAFVEAGGSLFTTDWALRHVLEPAFPGVLAYNDCPTRDDVVRIEIIDRENPFLAGVLDQGDDPQWWLEGSSYPIRILAPERVQVLLSSTELANKYGESPVAVLFKAGNGEVFHMISHYYLQRTELRDARHAQPASYFAEEKGVASGPEMDGLNLGEVEAAHSSARFLSNVIARKKRGEAVSR
ncbi:MAG: hypothetical protein WD942_05595 [Dehalococcoidia bacterium]